MVTDLAHLFSSEGPLAREINGYSPREAQLKMALAVEQAIANRRTLLAEAGTGTGKTLAYLIPALRSGLRIVISTGTRNLQDQLHHKDLPLARKALGLPIKAAVLKGRANYLCRYRLRASLGFRLGQRLRDTADLEAIRRWSTWTSTGDTDEISEVAEDSPVWPWVTSTADNCLGQDCPDYAGCSVAAARRRAHDSRLVIVNHHLLWADWVLRQDGLGELLPEAELLVIDEAHSFLQTSSAFLGVQLSSREIEECTEDIQLECQRFPGELQELVDAATELEFRIGALREILGDTTERIPWPDAYDVPRVAEGFTACVAQLDCLAEVLVQAASRSAGIETCRKRVDGVRSRIAMFTTSADADPGAVRWVETHRRSFQLFQTPIDAAESLSSFRTDSDAIWVLTSATLPGSGTVESAARSFGLDDDTLGFQCESPFDYQRNCLVYIPTGLPEPTSSDYTDAAVDALLPVLNASQGRAFVLFTSHQSLARGAELLSRAALPFPLFVQGSQPKSRLLERFEKSGSGVLLGTTSFWEGVDIRGPSLSCVIIHKLPFASPQEPLQAARIAAVREQGRDPFRELQLPAAILALRQGFGRLIRDVADRGVFVLCDPRVATRSYGRGFIRALPRMRVTRDIDDVEAFFKPSRGTEVSTR